MLGLLGSELAERLVEDKWVQNRDTSSSDRALTWFRLFMGAEAQMADEAKRQNKETMARLEATFSVISFIKLATLQDRNQALCPVLTTIPRLHRHLPFPPNPYVQILASKNMV